MNYVSQPEVWSIKQFMEQDPKDLFRVYTETLDDDLNNEDLEEMRKLCCALFKRRLDEKMKFYKEDLKDSPHRQVYWDSFLVISKTTPELIIYNNPYIMNFPVEGRIQIVK